MPVITKKAATPKKAKVIPRFPDTGGVGVEGTRVGVGTLVAVGIIVTPHVGPKVGFGLGVPGPTVAAQVGPKVGRGVAVCAKAGFAPECIK